MPLTKFGAILNFAETVEREDVDFYGKVESAAVSAPQQELFASLAKENKKNIALAQRSHQENVTEMILESIQDFIRAPYELKPEDLAGLDTAAAIGLPVICIRTKFSAVGQKLIYHNV